jgi:TRAP transporter 4TM/12TM fusion protein
MDLNEKKRLFDVDVLIKCIAVSAAIYHMVMVRWLFMPLDQHKVIHIGTGLCLVFLGAIRLSAQHPFKRLFLWCLALLAAGVSAYVVIEYESIATRIGFPVFADTVVGLILILLVLEGTRRAWGKVIPVVVVLAMLYGYFGKALPGIFYHGGMRLPRLIAYASTYFRGIYGSLTGTGSMEVFMFCMLGAFLSASGAIDFFISCAQSIGRRSRSGPAQAAIVASGLMGTVSGSVAANVITTGSVTIPLMINNGYRKEFAGAVSAVASTGGQLMPPVMGVAAFLISASTGTPYFTLCKMALLPAVAYYVYLFAAVHFRALKRNLPRPEMPPGINLIGTLKAKGYLLLPIVALMWFMAQHMSPSISAFYAIFILIGLYAIRTFFVLKFNIGAFFKEMIHFLYKGLFSGAMEGLKVGLILACLGIMVEIVVVTGFAQKLSFQMVELSGGYLPFLLVLVAITCIVFGVGMPTTGVYMVVSVLAAPALVKFGIPIVAAHLYVFYYGLMAMVTPPVAVGAIVASGIAKSDYMMTGIAASRLAVPGFLLPVFFIYRPQILFIGGTALDALVVFVSCCIALFCLAAALEGHMFRKLKLLEILSLGAAAMLLIDAAFLTSVIGFSLAAAVVFFQLRKSIDASVTPNGRA